MISEPWKLWTDFKPIMKSFRVLFSLLIYICTTIIALPQDISNVLPVQYVRVTCYSPDDPPRRTPPYIRPDLQDARFAAGKISDLDQRRPPVQSTWAQKGDFPASEVDFELPLVFDSGTARAIISMKPGVRNVKGTAFVYTIADQTPYVVWKCARKGEKNGLGGYSDIAGVLRLTVIGKTPGNGYGNGTDAGIDSSNALISGPFNSSAIHVR